METSLRLLIIDDEELMLSMFEALMAKHGHVIATARSGREGVEIARSGQFDVVITDIKMPDMDGIEVLKAVRALSDEIGVVLITGYASVDSAVAAMRLGADAYLLKPFRDFESDVLKVIERIAHKYGLLRENKRLTAELYEANEHLKRTNLQFRRALAQLNTLQQMASMLSGAADVETIAGIADQALVSGFETHAYALLLARRDGRFKLLRGAGLPTPADAAVTVQAGSGPLGEAFQRRRTTRLGPGSLDDEWREPWMPERSAALVTPCVAGGEVVAALVVFAPNEESLFAPESVSLYTGLAAQIAAPIAVAKLQAAGVAP